MTPEPILEVKFEGPNFEEGRIGLSILSGFCENFQALINGIGQNIMQETATAKKRKKAKEVKELCRLELSLLGKGCTKLGIDLSKEVLEFGRQPIEAFIEGYPKLLSKPKEVPNGFDDRAKDKLAAISNLLGDDERIFYSYRSNGRTKSVMQNKLSFSKMASTTALTEEKPMQVTGKLMMADFADIECEIHQPFGKIVKCTFEETLRPYIHLGLERQVEAKGRGTIETGKDELKGFQITEISVSDESGNLMRLGENYYIDDFWAPINLDLEAKRQGIKPVQNYEDIAGGWPEDESFDEFLAAIREGRGEVVQ